MQLIRSRRAKIIAIFILVFILARTLLGYLLNAPTNPVVLSTPLPTTPTSFVQPVATIPPSFLSPGWWDEFFKELTSLDTLSEFLGAAISGVIVTILMSAMLSALRRSPLLNEKVIRIGSEKIQVDFGDIDGVMHLLERKMLNAQAVDREITRQLDNLLSALDRNEISLEEAQGMAQAASLVKWLSGDNTGWYELQEEVTYGAGLHPSVRTAVEKELMRVQEKRKPGDDPKYKKQLEFLLSFHQKGSYAT